MSQILPTDCSFKQYWTHPTDAQVERLYSESNWKWLLGKRKEARSSSVPISASVQAETTQPYLDTIRVRVEEDGYYTSSNMDVKPPTNCIDSSTNTDRLKSAIKLLVAQGYPATFVLLLDECWDAVHSMSEMMQAGTGNSVCNMDILAWQVDPKEGSGFSPHRDRQPDDVASSFRSDGTPKYATFWMALSSAHCDNSCLYVIPKYLDPGYSSSDFPTTVSADSLSRVSRKVRSKGQGPCLSDSDTHSDPLRTALKDKQSYQHIRALPLLPGEFVIFTHRIMHWGSKGRTSYRGEPRISLSVAFSDPEFEAPYFSMPEDGRPSFGMRLALACAQMIIYYQRYNFSGGELLMFKKSFDRHAQHFHADYRRKVLFEYSSAIMECENAAVALDSGSESGAKGLESTGPGSRNGDRDTGGSEDDEADSRDSLVGDGSGEGEGEDEDDDAFDGGEEEEGPEGEEDESEESSDEEDGGFFLSNEEEKDDPVEHALDAMLDIEAQTHRIKRVKR